MRCRDTVRYSLFEVGMRPIEVDVSTHGNLDNRQIRSMFRIGIVHDVVLEQLDVIVADCCRE